MIETAVPYLLMIGVTALAVWFVWAVGRAEKRGWRDPKRSPAPPAVAETLVDTVREPGSSTISIDRLIEMLNMQPQTFAEAAGVHRNTLRLNPDNEKAQAFARDVVRVLQAAVDLGNDSQTALYHVKNSPIRSFEYKTAWEMIEAARTEDVVGYLESLSAGYAG